MFCESFYTEAAGFFFSPAAAIFGDIQMPDTAHAKDLRQERAKLHSDMVDMAKVAKEESRKFTPDERSKFDAMKTDIEGLKERIDDLEAIEEIGRDMNDPIGDGQRFHTDDGRVTDRRPADRDKIITHRDCDYALRAWMLPNRATDKMLEAADKCGMDMRSNEMEFELADTEAAERMRRQFRENGIVYRATTPQSKGTNAKGGFTVPTELATTIEEALLNFGGMRARSTILRTDSGHDFNIPTADDTNNVSTVLAENTAATTKDLNFAQVTLRAAKYESGIVKASIELLQDTAVDLVGYIGRAIGTRHARGTNRDYTTGSTATTSPRGIIRDSQQGYAATTATGGDIGVRPITELIYSVDLEYRSSGAFMMNDGIAKEVFYEVDSNGQPLWQVGLQAGQPDLLRGFPVVINNRLTASSTGAGQTLMLFGDLSKYVIRDVRGGQLIRFNERFMEKLQVGWLGVMRTDGKVLLASTRAASKPIKHLKGTT